MTTFDDIVKKVLANKNPPIVSTIDAAAPSPTPVKKVKKPKVESKPVALVSLINQDQATEEALPDENVCGVCGKLSKVGAHGIRDGKVYSEYYCFAHYNAKPGTTITRESEEPDEQVTST